MRLADAALTGEVVGFHAEGLKLGLRAIGLAIERVVAGEAELFHAAEEAVEEAQVAAHDRLELAELGDREVLAGHGGMLTA